MEIHEIYGDNKFAEAKAEERLATDRSGLRLIPAEADFRFDPEKHYSLTSKGLLRIDSKKRRSTK